MTVNAPHGRLFHRHAATGARRGMVLILVLVIVMMVSLAGFSFVATVYNEEKATRLRGAEIQAIQLAQSAVVMIKAVAVQPPDEMQNAGGIYDNQDLFPARVRGLQIVYTLDGRLSNQFHISLSDTL